MHALGWGDLDWLAIVATRPCAELTFGLDKANEL